MAVSTDSADFIARSLGERKAAEESRASIETTLGLAQQVCAVGARTEKLGKFTRWVALASLVITLGLLGVTNYTLQRLQDAEARILALIPPPPPPPDLDVTIKVQQWTSGPFVSGVVECGEKSGEPDPCDCWYSRTNSGQADCTKLPEIAQANRDTVLVFANGGHDRVDLTSAGRETLGTNDNVAYQRAKAVAAQFRKELTDVRGCKGDACDIPEAISTRGLWDQQRKTPSDRTVTVTLFRREKTS
jgi:hypothetical protein